MSGIITICSTCGGELTVHPYETGKYTLCGGWCPNCQKPVVTVPEKAYDDDDYDAEGYACEVASKVRESHYKEYRIVDSPDFQFKWTDKPTKEHRCSSCKHGYRKVVDGKDTGQSCRIGKSPDYDYDAYVNRCDDYRPLDTWNNMGGQCRYCLYNCQQMCLHKGNLKVISDYAKGHCEHFVCSTIWGFERTGFTSCPKCHQTASITKFGKVKCEYCNESWSLEDIEKKR